jgi:hypothetical protein
LNSMMLVARFIMHRGTDHPFWAACVRPAGETQSTSRVIPETAADGAGCLIDQALRVKAAINVRGRGSGVPAIASEIFWKRIPIRTHLPLNSAKILQRQRVQDAVLAAFGAAIFPIASAQSLGRCASRGLHAPSATVTVGIGAQG